MQKQTQPHADMVDVAAAIIQQDRHILICQRPEDKSNALLWEFPGGKREPGETLTDCLVRECREELAVTVEVGRMLAETTHAYPDITVHLTFFEARIVSGTLTRREHADLRWVTPEDIPAYLFCPADTPLLETLTKTTT